MRFPDYLKEIAKDDDEFGRLSRLLLSKSDVRMFVSDMDETKYIAGRFPVYSNNVRTYREYIMLNMPEFLTVFLTLAEEYARFTRNRAWLRELNDITDELAAPIKPVRKVDFKKLSRNAAKKFIN